MNKISNCPGCSAPIPPGSNQCPYCGQYIVSSGTAAPPPQDIGPKLTGWLQGIGSDGRSNGSYDTTERTFTYMEALDIVYNLPVPPRGKPIGEYCPPAIGFGDRNISRMDNGDYFLWPEDRNCDQAEAKRILKEIFS